jgi:ribosomal protein L11 methyltransferase
MNEIYLDLCFAVPADQDLRDAIPALLSAAGFTGFADDEKGFHSYIPKKLYDEQARIAVDNLLAAQNESGFSLLSVEEIENRNWNAEWEATIQPLRISDRIIIAPSWHSVSLLPGEIAITIDPKMSFGTGYHESTRLMIRLIEQTVHSGDTVLDVGTGTGVLAIVAVKLGARSAVAVDVDEWTAVNGKENVERNGLTGTIDIRHGSLEIVPETRFDLVLANIQRNVILDLLPSMLSKMSPNGTLLLSGLMLSDREAIVTALREAQLTTDIVLQENEWIGLSAHAHRLP